MHVIIAPQSCGEGEVRLLAAQSPAPSSCTRWMLVGWAGEKSEGLGLMSLWWRGESWTYFASSTSLIRTVQQISSAPHPTGLGDMRVVVEIEGQGVIVLEAAGPCVCLAHLVTSSKGHR